MRNIFENLRQDDLTVHVMLNLQDRYPDLDPEALSSYRSRVELRVVLLKEFAEKNNIPLGIDCTCLNCQTTVMSVIISVKMAVTLVMLALIIE